jgi:hypothetical protein
VQLFIFLAQEQGSIGFTENSQVFKFPALIPMKALQNAYQEYLFPDGKSLAQGLQ